MVRPVASELNRLIALAFAASVTQITRDTIDTVARNGHCGLFSALRDVYPKAVRDELSGVRDGVSEMEFNKTLQVVGQHAVDFLFETHLKIFTGLRI